MLDIHLVQSVVSHSACLELHRSHSCGGSGMQGLQTGGRIFCIHIPLSKLVQPEMGDKSADYKKHLAGRCLNTAWHLFPKRVIVAVSCVKSALQLPLRMTIIICLLPCHGDLGQQLCNVFAFF